MWSKEIHKCSLAYDIYGLARKMFAANDDRSLRQYQGDRVPSPVGFVSTPMWKTFHFLEDKEHYASFLLVSFAFHYLQLKLLQTRFEDFAHMKCGNPQCLYYVVLASPSSCPSTLRFGGFLVLIIIKCLTRGYQNVILGDGQIWHRFGGCLTLF